MTLLLISSAIFLAGCFGGLVNALLSGALHLPRIEKRPRVWRPGWIGNVIVGGTAALVFWGLYGPAAGIQVVGGTSSAVGLRLGELVGAILTGIGGGRLLTAEIDRRVLQKDNMALTTTKQILTDTLGRVAGVSSTEKSSHE